ncbi:MAG TPA: DinB family protein [Acidobacteriaceae bacterium]|nr:DinB family protein [Acidobacteriaceae bacterium]
MPSDDQILREQLVEFLDKGHAHIELFSAIKDFPKEHYGTKPEGAPHSAWQLLEHIRIALNDILSFSTDSNYSAPKWPDDYWPKEAPPSADEWKHSVQALHADLEAFKKLIRNPESNLYSRIPWGDGQTLLREALLAIDHTSYHLGQLVMLRKQLTA